MSPKYPDPKAKREPWRISASDYERGFIDGMQKQAQSSVDRAVNARANRVWVGLTLDEIDLLEELYAPPVHPDFVNDASHCLELIRHVEAKLKEKNA